MHQVDTRPPRLLTADAPQQCPDCAETRSLAELSASQQQSLFRLRHDVFVRSLSWVPESGDMQETDAFDHLDQAHYVIASLDGLQIDACVRLLPTTGPNMVRDIFPMLVNGPVPADMHIWELSRCAIAVGREPANGRPPHPQFGNGVLLGALVHEAIAFARRHHIKCYLAVTTVSSEPLLHALGIPLRRAGPVLHRSNMEVVACYIDIGDNL